MPTAINLSSQENHNPIMLFDGKSVSNPGAAAAAAVLLMNNGRRYTVSQFLSSATVEEAEYTGLIIGLQKAKQLGIKNLDIKSDSELILKQVNEPNPVIEDKLLTLYSQAQKLLKNFEKTSLECISEELNRPAINAVNRCISEALGRKSKTTLPPVSPPVAHFLQLADKVTDKDYQKLILKNDDFAFMTLTDLRLLVPEAVRDMIALQWDGNNQTLADIYRWYLRGLPPQMALQKAQLDNPSPESSGEKLPWEGELIVPSGMTVSIETSEAFVESPFSEESAIVSPKIFNDKETLLKIPLEEESCFFAATGTHNKDTLPPNAKIKNVLEMMNHLSVDEKLELAEQLIHLPEWVNLIFIAIASQLASPKD
ncbi:ribonuclease HI [Aphanothece hegewaldii CCALA 016]|uniref:Ribonuclease HI n=1 Tax=Aphanothece hegewaldii CCALA 016 TaxID=2107694 RepID=A0A2T1LXD3_9CHRO|nr:ribonuclease HI family protein [Aphanothece hegewaldii]PSF36849.1 ribonuclease HI [Aphanothece hegewaldii CCALA 016]